MYWTFSNQFYLFNTFGMSGQWSNQKGKHPCLSFIFENDERIYFNDPRHFGTIKFTNDLQDLSKKLNSLGWDPLQMSLDKNLPWIKWKLSKSNKSIAETLMDQSIFAGVGNYVRAEALYSAKLRPLDLAHSLKEDQIIILCQAIISVMEESYQHQGATIKTYKTPYGEEGRYSTFFKVYGQKQDPLGNKIIKQDLSGRTIHWCPAIQI